MRSNQVIYLSVHTLLVLVSFSLFFGFVLDVVRPAPADTDTVKYGGHNCLHHITEADVSNIRGDVAIFIGTITFMLVTALTGMRMISHWDASKGKLNYKVASLFSSLFHEENRIVNLFLLVMHVMSAVFIWSLHAHTQTTSDHEVQAGFLNACTHPDDLPEQMSLWAATILMIAIVMEIGLQIWNRSCKDCKYAKYSFKDVADNVIAKISEKGIDLLRNLILLVATGSVFASFMYSLNNDLNCSQNEVRVTFFALFFAVAALCMVTTRPERGAKSLACLIAAIAVCAFVVLNWVDLVAYPHSTACTNTMGADNKRRDNAESLRTSIIISFWTIIAYAFLELAGSLLVSCFYSTKNEIQVRSLARKAGINTKDARNLAQLDHPKSEETIQFV